MSDLVERLRAEQIFELDEACDRIEDLEWIAKQDLRRIEELNRSYHRLVKALQHCVNAIAEWEKQPDGVGGFLLGAMDNAIAVLSMENQDDN